MNAHEVLRVLDALHAAGIEPGITGGWGIDALLGRETRPHGDLDLGMDAWLVGEAVTVLRSLGYAVAQDQRPARLELRGPQGRVDLHPIEWDPAGFGIQHGFDGKIFEYPAGSLLAPGSIAGRPVACGTPQLQLAFHLGYDPTAKDRSDMAALADAFGLSLPAPYAVSIE